MKYRTTPECPAVGARMREIYGAIASTITEEHEVNWDDAVELSALSPSALHSYLVAKSRTSEPEIHL